MKAKPWGRGVLVASGGIDSTVLMYHLAKQNLVHTALFFDYGQRSAGTCWNHVLDHATLAGVGAHRVKMLMPTQKGGVYERSFVPTVTDDADGSIGLEGEELLEWRRTQWSWIEARNSLFVIWAAGWAAEMKLSRVYVGFQEESREQAEDDDRDVTIPFVAAVNALLTFGSLSRSVQVVAPFLDTGMTKAAIVELGRALNVSMERTHSCEFFPACGVCGACKRRQNVIG